MPKHIIIASWNVNSIRAHLDHVQDWITRVRPDVLCLQETKVLDADFPHEMFKSLGYEVAIYGQRTYNGVAIASLLPMTDVVRGLADDGDEGQRRVIAATIAGIRVVDVYIPNGQSVGSEKFIYKMEFLTKLGAYLKEITGAHNPVLVCGDYNIAPADIDVYDPVELRETIMFHSMEHKHLDEFRKLGFVDPFRVLNPDGKDLYSWWDYRAGAFQRNRGYRIDHIWVTPPLDKLCVEYTIDKLERDRTKPSDHAPIMAEFVKGY